MFPTAWKLLLLLVVLLTAGVQAAVIITTGPDPLGHAEVHDMMRNSEQRSWCVPGLIKQIVTHANCASHELENKVCAGSCFSYSLPQTQPELPGDEALQFCESCQPSESQWLNITMECTAEDDSTYQITKSVQQITNCTCSSCPGLKRHNPPVVSSREEAIDDDDQRMTELLYRALPPSADGGPPQDPGSGPRSSLPPTLASLGAGSEVVTSLGPDSISVALGLPPDPTAARQDISNVLTAPTLHLLPGGSDQSPSVHSLSHHPRNSLSLSIQGNGVGYSQDFGSSGPSISTFLSPENTIETGTASVSHSSTTPFANPTPLSLTTPYPAPDTPTAAADLRPLEEDDGDIMDNSINENSFRLPRVRPHEGSLKHDFPGTFLLREDNRGSSNAEPNINILHSVPASENISEDADNEQHQGLKDIMTNLNALINRGYNGPINQLKYVINTVDFRPTVQPPEKPEIFNSSPIEDNI